MNDRFRIITVDNEVERIVKKILLGVILALALILSLIGTTVPTLADSPTAPAPAIDIEKLVSVDGGTT
jgi:hypothetical protein